MAPELAQSYESIAHLERWLTIAFGLGLALLLSLAAFQPAEVGEAFAREDGPVEWASAGLYAAGIAACVFAITRRSNVGWAIFWLALSVAFLGEEVSWFQRQIGFTVESVQSMNVQNEFNLHNLAGLHGGYLLEGDRSLLKSLLSSQNLFRLGFFGWFFVLPILALAGLFAWGPLQRLRYVPPTKALTVMIWPLFAYAAVLSLISQGSQKASVAETTEMAFAAVVFLYTLSLLRNHARG